VRDGKWQIKDGKVYGCQACGWLGTGSGFKPRRPRDCPRCGSMRTKVENMFLPWRGEVAAAQEEKAT